MAEFKEELVINALHPEKAEVGKEYWYSDILSVLKKYVEGNNTDLKIDKPVYAIHFKLEK